MTHQVILLHGLMRTFLSMKYLGRRLSAAGYVVHNYDYPTRRYSIEKQALALHDFLATRIDRSAELSFVTHSLGSIITRQFALNYWSEYKLKRVVMLGPPNQGSQTARRLHSLRLPGKFLGPAFVELTNLALAPATDRVEIGIIAGGTLKPRGLSPLLEGDDDGIVSVAETKLEGAKDFIVLRGVHAFLMYYPSVIEQTLHFLEQGEFRR